MKKLVLAVVLSGFSFSSLAIGLADQVANESSSHNDRIAILQEAEACIQSSDTKAEYLACGEKEKQARKALRGKRFETRKNTILKNIANRRAALDEFESCVKASSDLGMLKTCWQQRKARK